MPGKANRSKGHNYERFLRRVFIDLGYPKCVTTRQGSHLLDSCGIDLMNIPILVQAKAVKGNINYKKVFDYMDEQMKEYLPEDSPEFDKPKAIFHKKSRKKNEHYVVIPYEDFIKLIK